MGSDPGSADTTVSVEGIRALADLCLSAGVHEIEASDGGWSVRLLIDGTLAAAAPEGDDRALAAGEPAGPHIVHSEWVGIFHRAIDGVSASYVQEGQQVRSGDVVCAIEAMQMQHEQCTDRDGVIARFLVEDGTPIEYGQPLLEIG